MQLIVAIDTLLELLNAFDCFLSLYMRNVYTVMPREQNLCLPIARFQSETVQSMD